MSFHSSQLRSGPHSPQPTEHTITQTIWQIVSHDEAMTEARKLARLSCHHRPKASSTGQKEVVTGQAKLSVPPEPKQKSQLARPRRQAPRTQTEVAACQATTQIPPDAQTEIEACQTTTPMPHAQTEVAACQATTSSPQNPNRSRSLPNHDLKPP
ncbi:hypothetical protein B0H11DRAFT_1907413 [Mycena galericulata]|nr:hypothetical protein B0H11DRAFT_1907413 [Mycena galericulata]